MTLRVGLVGAGFMGSVHAAGWTACDGVEVVGTATSGDELGPLIVAADVIDVCAPTHLHHDIVVRAAAGGVDVICEKPLARTVEQGEAMLAACADAGVTLLVGHVVRFFPEYAAAKAVVDAGDVGTPAVVRLARQTFQPRKPEGNWFLDPNKSGGMILDLMVHDFDYARWVAGDVATVYARRVGGLDTGTPEYALAILRHTAGAISHVAGSWAHPPPTFHTALEIAGTGGVVRFDSDETTPVRPLLHEWSDGAGEVPLPGSPLAEPPHTTQLRHFLDVLSGGAAPIVTAEDALEALRIGVAAIDSANSGRPVSIGGREVAA